MTLDEQITQLVNLGEQDPVLIAEKIKARGDKKWLAAELFALADDIISERARQLLGVNRRSGELALRPGDVATSAGLKRAKTWVPDEHGGGWQKAADLTAADLRAKAGWYEQLAFSSARRAWWCREVADQIDAEGCGTLGKLRAALPVLPEREELVA